MLSASASNASASQSPLETRVLAGGRGEVDRAHTDRNRMKQNHAGHSLVPTSAQQATSRFVASNPNGSSRSRDRGCGFSASSEDDHRPEDPRRTSRANSTPPFEDRYDRSIKVSRHGYRNTEAKHNFDELSRHDERTWLLWCFDSFSQRVPNWLMVHVAMLILILYGGYFFWAFGNIVDWTENCDMSKPGSTKVFQFTVASTACMFLSLMAAVYVGFHVGDINAYISIIAAIVDLLAVAMVIWGIVNMISGLMPDCRAVAAGDRPSFALFLTGTLICWVIHFFVTGALVDCLGRLR